MGAASGPWLFAFEFLISQIISGEPSLDESSPGTTTTTTAEYQLPVVVSMTTTTVDGTMNHPEAARTKPAAGPPMLRSRQDGADEDLDEPSLTLSDTSDSFASIDDFLSWPDVEEEEEEVTEEYGPRRPRGVTFHPHVEVREYSLTISDHPFCDDAYPISLDWAHARPYVRHIDESKSRGFMYTPGPRICVEAKRRRLAEVRGCSETDIEEMIRSPYELVALGRLLLSYISMWLQTVAFPPLKRHELDDEYLFLYAGTTHNSGKKPPMQQVLIEHDLEAGF
jgi:hypothetical protein